MARASAHYVLTFARLPTPGSVLGILGAALLLVFLLQPVELAAQNNCGGNVVWLPQGDGAFQPPNCLFRDPDARCYQPEIGGATWAADPGCDPKSSSCGLTVEVPINYPGNHLNDPAASGFFYSFATVIARRNGSFLGQCGVAGAVILNDMGILSWGFTGTCSDPTAVFEVEAISCPCNPFPPFNCPLCDKTSTDSFPLADSPLCQEPPPKDDCNDCFCRISGSGGPGSGGPGSPPGSGPKATLSYRANGVGHPGFPGTAAWNAVLGRYWSHDYAERIVADPDETHVWLITRLGTFREFNDLVGGVYQTNSPTDEYRTLTFLGAGIGWRLDDLEGTVQFFDAAGRWTQTVDRNGNAKTATYGGGGELSMVSFPDGRREDFTYHPDGRLATITEVGVGGTTSRTWSYTWSGLDLTRIDRPDGTAWEFRYDDAAHPGYMTRMTLLGTDASQRIEGAWEYDAEGNVVKRWKGTAAATDPGVIDLWSLSYDAPADPTESTVTDPLGNLITYTFARDASSDKARVTSIAGDCPTCGVGPNAAFEYTDASNPLLPTAVTDGRGHRTEMTYDGNGQLLTRTEAVLEPAERTTAFTYDANFPAFLTSVEVPSTSGGLGVRRIETIIDPSTGNANLRRITGVEGGGAFQYDTVMSYNGAGQPTAIDPPGYGASDVTSFTYDPARGNLLPLTRTDPLVGTTAFGYDAFNRRTSVTDANSVVTEIEYDALDRVTRTIQKAAAAADDLVSENVYNVFGDLETARLPEGNVIVYEYDPAGRLLTISRGPMETDLRERAKYSLDAAGNRVKQELQRFDPAGGTWLTESATDFVYSGRCQLTKIVRAPGTPEEAATEYEYDCNGNLERVWDANHDSAVDPPSQLYTYDALDRLTSVTQPWAGAGGGTAVTTYGYDVQDHLTSVTDAEGNLTTYIYGDRDLPTRQVSPVSGQSDFTYNEHGELITEMDARAVLVARTVDELDRVSLIDYPDNTLDTAYVYDDAAIPFSQGRLTSISRNGTSVEYEYDRFGRVTRDGELTFAYDKNGNRETIGYPGGVSTAYTYDYAGRPETLSVSDGVSPMQPVVTAASYLPMGPLATLGLGNGLVETRSFDGRYAPTAIDLSGHSLRTWSYSTDSVGNILEIEETVGCQPSVQVDNRTLSEGEIFEACVEITSANTTVDSVDPVIYRAGRSIELQEGFEVAGGAAFVVELDERLDTPISFTYQYQDHHYFLTAGSGPWGVLGYTYDKIGNRLTETRDGVTNSYGYVPGASGNTPILDSITLGVGGVRDYTWGPAGHLEEVAAGGNLIDFTSDQEGRLAALDRLGNTVTNTYDGRGFLRKVSKPLGGGDFRTTEPTYGSEGLLYALTRKADSMAAPQQLSYFYFAGRPVAQLGQDGATSTWTFLSADHLGTPFAATDATGTTTWLGPFEPFGRDYLAGTVHGAVENETFLRFPGQWDDGTWSEASSGADLYYNVYRWYRHGTGAYGRRDPLRVGGRNDPYIYGLANPLRFLDPLGLQATPPPPTDRDPFEPPIDPEFGSGPWGTRPDPDCCDEDEIGDAIQSAQDQIDRTDRGEEPSGTTIGGAVISEHACGVDGWCIPVPPSTPFDPFINPNIADPCVRYCVRTHEWFHYRDRRPWHLDWSSPRLSKFWERPAYGLEKACLQSFLQ